MIKPLWVILWQLMVDNTQCDCCCIQWQWVTSSCLTRLFDLCTCASLLLSRFQCRHATFLPNGETVEIVDPWDTDILDYRLIQTRTRRAWKGFWLVCFLFCFFFSRFQELFLLELVSCWVDLPKGSFQWKFAKNLPTTKILKKHGHLDLVHKCLR